MLVCGSGHNVPLAVGDHTMSSCKLRCRINMATNSLLKSQEDESEKHWAF